MQTAPSFLNYLNVYFSFILYLSVLLNILKLLSSSKAWRNEVKLGKMHNLPHTYSAYDPHIINVLPSPCYLLFQHVVYNPALGLSKA